LVLEKLRSDYDRRAERDSRRFMRPLSERLDRPGRRRRSRGSDRSPRRQVIFPAHCTTLDDVRDPYRQVEQVYDTSFTPIHTYSIWCVPATTAVHHPAPAVDRSERRALNRADCAGAYRDWLQHDVPPPGTMRRAGRRTA